MFIILIRQFYTNFAFSVSGLPICRFCVLGLVLPTHTTTTANPTFSPFQAIFLPLVNLAKKLVIPVAYGTQRFGAPLALGGFLIAILILSSEVMSAIKAARRNDLQHSINIALGSALATIGLTIPAVLTIGLITGKTIIPGLNAADTVLLVLSLILSIITFSNERTNILLGAVHLLLFLAYLMLIFEG